MRLKKARGRKWSGHPRLGAKMLVNLKNKRPKEYKKIMPIIEMSMIISKTFSNRVNQINQ